MNEFKDQLDSAEKEKVTKLVEELREIASKGQAGETGITAAQIKEKIDETQQASLGLFQKVRVFFNVLYQKIISCYNKGVREEERGVDPVEEDSSGVAVQHILR